ncbi:YlbF family regulator [Petroclostridium sp. X23]|uniref:YlbF family regulator n=1 Tax=Petroclostridium sp. X23 TaxID=3045146 RepID=UPI0024ADE7BF|nr:YlbF family regulator [Petroclostridium sp. X23]WHH59557.1 YlbF family regulator [Petroclostridium sp. X23]
MDTIIEKAKKLGQMIAGSKEYIRLKDAETNQKNDEQAQQMLAQYTELKKKAAIRMKQEQLGSEDISAVKKEIQDEFDKLMQNEVIKEYVEAKKAFDNLAQLVNEGISYYITSQEKKGCAPSKCGGCSGCQ